jgi:hypothetical protein
MLRFAIFAPAGRKYGEQKKKSTDLPQADPSHCE